MRILFFGRIRDIAGASRDLDVRGLETVGEVTAALSRDEALAGLLNAPGTRTVLDNEIVSPGASIAGAGELAYLPPVSGG